jgi:PPM family protein phosphatase
MSGWTDMSASTYTHQTDGHFVIRTRVEEAVRGRGEDRIAVTAFAGGRAILVADGAGGVTGGARATDLLCGALSTEVSGPHDWAQWLRSRDRAMAAEAACGLAAAVVLSVADDGALHGASVGDCEAWVFSSGAEAFELTGTQRHKPMLGSGDAQPVAFSGWLRSGTLVIGTDGLWRYTKAVSWIAQAAASRSLDEALATMIDCVRLRSGTLQDDVGVAVCRVT